MAEFQITFYRAALVAGIEANAAQALTELTEEFIVSKVAEANREVLAKLEAVNGRLANIEGRIDTRVSMSRLQLAFVIATAAVGSTFGPTLMKILGIG
ncbi:hypothetical protein PK98_15205 [Croceibacterium mercuriale]|uniref:Uncharacterized protein n=1 Tax=Croceibacterium mercuriale TaxID=1572751 RepID=A0A0B2BWU5_9SPHN|nr:hypothetical protein [Croceibacterium mercuriale]KHL24305.1 hypothetical protein PK98_15205 [Croceibacterium mercuriale]